MALIVLVGLLLVMHAARAQKVRSGPRVRERSRQPFEPARGFGPLSATVEPKIEKKIPIHQITLEGPSGSKPLREREVAFANTHLVLGVLLEQQQTAEEAAALVVLCARKHRRRARLLTLISQHTRTKANHRLELTKRFEGGVVSACASGAPPVRLRCASGAPPVRLRCASGAPPLPPACLTHLATLRFRHGVRAARLSLAAVAVVVDAPQLQPSTVCVPNR